MEELESQIRNMFNGIYQVADIKYLRPLKRQMFKCGHDCLDDKNDSKQVDRCTDDCGRVLHAAMRVVHKEINSFQGRIDRCLMDCQDNIRNEKNEQKAKRLFEDCSGACVKKHIPLVPEVTQNICSDLDKLKKIENIS